MVCALSETVTVLSLAIIDATPPSIDTPVPLGSAPKLAISVLPSALLNSSASLPSSARVPV